MVEKTEFLEFGVGNIGNGNRVMLFGGKIVSRVDEFKYLGSVI